MRRDYTLFLKDILDAIASIEPFMAQTGLEPFFAG